MIEYFEKMYTATDDELDSLRERIESLEEMDRSAMQDVQLRELRKQEKEIRDQRNDYLAACIGVRERV